LPTFAGENLCLYFNADTQGLAEYLLGDYAADDRRDQADNEVILALAVSRQDRSGEAQQLITPIVAYQRGLAARNHGDQQQKLELAVALYAQAMIDARQRAVLLPQAAALRDALPASVRALHSAQLWRGKIREAQHGSASASPADFSAPSG
jgi:hypothetical protein